MPISILNQKSQSINQIELSTSMDVIAISTKDGLISLYRIFTWELVFSQSVKELSGNDEIRIMKFSPKEKHLAIATERGRIFILNLENKSFSEANLKYQKSILSLNWIETQQIPGKHFHIYSLNDDLDEKDPTLTLMKSLSTTTMACFYQHGEVVLLLHGVYPIKSFVLNIPVIDMQLFQTKFNRLTILNKEKNKLNFFFLEEEHLSSSISKTSSIDLEIRISTYINNVNELINALSRKWKESIKLFTPKLNLLVDILNTYEMNLSPLEFFQTIASSGLWHPAALTSFSQHWNEQGLTRLRTNLDCITKFIIRNLELVILPIVQNIEILLNRYLFNELENQSIEIEIVSNVKVCLSTSILGLLQAIEDAKLAREKTLLMVQFLRDYHLEANSLGTQEQANFNLDLDKRTEFLRLFNPLNSQTSDLVNIENILNTSLGSHLSSDVKSKSINQECKETIQNSFKSFSESFQDLKRFLNSSIDVQTDISKNIEFSFDGFEVLSSYYYFLNDPIEDMISSDAHLFLFTLQSTFETTEILVIYFLVKNDIEESFFIGKQNIFPTTRDFKLKSRIYQKIPGNVISFLFLEDLSTITIIKNSLRDITFQNFPRNLGQNLVVLNREYLSKICFTQNPNEERSEITNQNMQNIKISDSRGVGSIFDTSQVTLFDLEAIDEEDDGEV